MYYYHMTSLDRLVSISKMGLTPRNENNSKLINDEKNKVFFSEGFEGAIALFVDFEIVYENIKEGKSNLKVPVYSHLTYDIVPNQYTIVDRPNVLILEGVNVLQDGTEYPEYRKKAFISDYIDYSIYVDADEKHLMKWYVDRFLKLKEQAFSDPNCYFNKYANLPDENAESIAKLIWEAVNHVNLIENILPCRNRANLILKKGEDHHIEEIYLRK